MLTQAKKKMKQTSNKQTGKELKYKKWNWNITADRYELHQQCKKRTETPYFHSGSSGQNENERKG